MMNGRWKWIVFCFTLLLVAGLASAVHSGPEEDSSVYLPAVFNPLPRNWAKSVGTQYRYPEAFYVDELQDGSLILIGKLDFEPWFARVDPHGHVVTSKSFDLLTNRDAPAAKLANGDYVVAGTSRIYGNDEYIDQLWLARIGPQGQVQWQKTFPSEEAETAIDVAIAPNSQFYVATDRRDNTGRVLKLNYAGEVQWSRTIDYQGDANIEVMTNTNDGGVLVAGVEWIGNNGMWSAKLDPAGDLVWKKNYHLLPDYYNDWYLPSAAPAGTKGAVLAGEMILGGEAGFILFIGDEGDIHWARAYMGQNTKSQGFRYASQTGDGNLLVTGLVMPSSLSDSDIWLLKLTSSGDVIWQRRYGDDRWDLGARVAEQSDGSILMLANAWDYFGTINDFLWLFKLDSNGVLPGCGLGPYATAATVHGLNMVASDSDMTIGSGPVDVAMATERVELHQTVGSFLCPGTTSAADCR